MVQERTSYADALQHLRQVIADHGVRAGLRYLNQRAGVRYSALYRFDGDVLHNLCLVDRDDPVVESTGDIPVLASYCVFVRESGSGFTTDDAPADERTEHHPKRRQIRSYCGVPLVDASGRMFGSACHFHPDPVVIGPQDVALLEALAPLLTTAITDSEWCV